MENYLCVATGYHGGFSQVTRGLNAPAAISHVIIDCFRRNDSSGDVGVRPSLYSTVKLYNVLNSFEDFQVSSNL